MSVSVSFEASALEEEKKKRKSSFGTSMLPNLTALVLGPTSKLRTLLPGTCGSYGDLLTPVFDLAPGTQGTYPLAQLLPDAAASAAESARHGSRDGRSPSRGDCGADDLFQASLVAGSLDEATLATYVDEQCAKVEREMPRLFKEYGRAPRKIKTYADVPRPPSPIALPSPTSSPLSLSLFFRRFCENR